VTKVRDLAEIEARIAAEGDQIRAYGVKTVGLFGSFARGAQNDESDVDLLVVFQDGRKTFDAFMNLSFFMEGLLGRRVELLTPESLSPYIGPKILREVVHVPIGG
jgi:hypothetical protein